MSAALPLQLEAVAAASIASSSSAPLACLRRRQQLRPVLRPWGSRGIICRARGSSVARDPSILQITGILLLCMLLQLHVDAAEHLTGDWKS